MAFHCANCKYAASPADDFCRHCMSHGLVCGACNRAKTTGLSSCPCETAIALSSPAPAPTSHALLPFSLTRIQLPPPVKPVYTSGELGATAQIQLGGRDAEILTKMGQSAALLLALANEMNGLKGHMETTRSLITKARILAAELQGEVEIRLGPTR